MTRSIRRFHSVIVESGDNPSLLMTIAIGVTTVARLGEFETQERWPRPQQREGAKFGSQATTRWHRSSILIVYNASRGSASGAVCCVRGVAHVHVRCIRGRECISNSISIKLYTQIHHHTTHAQSRTPPHDARSTTRDHSRDHEHGRPRLSETRIYGLAPVSAHSRTPRQSPHAHDMRNALSHGRPLSRRSGYARRHVPARRPPRTRA